MAYTPISSQIKQLFIPGGIVYWSLLDANERPTGGYSDFGQVDDFNLSIEGEFIEIYTARNAQKELYDKTSLGVTRTASLTIKQFSEDNFALFLSATKAVETQTAGSVTNEDIVVALDRYYQLGETVANPKGVRSLTGLSFAIKEGETASGWVTATVTALGAFVKQASNPTHYFEATDIGSAPHQTGTPEPTWVTTLGGTTTDGDITWTCRGLITPTLTTDYTVDATLGWVYIPLTSRIIPGHSLRVDYTKSLVYRPTLTTGASATTNVAIKIKSNPIKGTAHDFLFPVCTLSPSGELPILAEEPAYNRMTFELSILKPSNGPSGEDIAAIYVDGRPVA